MTESTDIPTKDTRIPVPRGSRFDYWSMLLLSAVCVIEVVWFISTGHFFRKFTLNQVLFLVFLEGAWLFGHKAWHARRGDR